MQKVMEGRGLLGGALSRLSTLTGSQTGRKGKLEARTEALRVSWSMEDDLPKPGALQGTENILAMSHTLILKDVSGNSVES